MTWWLEKLLYPVSPVISIVQKHVTMSRKFKRNYQHPIETSFHYNLETRKTPHEHTNQSLPPPTILTDHSRLASAGKDWVRWLILDLLIILDQSQVAHGLGKDTGASWSAPIPSCEQNNRHEWKHYLSSYYVRGRQQLELPKAKPVASKPLWAGVTCSNGLPLHPDTSPFLMWQTYPTLEL